MSRYGFTEEEMDIFEDLDKRSMADWAQPLNVPRWEGIGTTIDRTFNGDVNAYVRYAAKQLRDSWYKLDKWDKEKSKMHRYHATAVKLIGLLKAHDFSITIEESKKEVMKDLPKKEVKENDSEELVEDEEIGTDWSKGYLKYYKELAVRGFDPIEIIMAGYLREKYYLVQRRRPTRYVFDTSALTEQTTNIKKVARRNAIVKLKKYGIISTFKWDKQARKFITEEEAPDALKRTKLWFIWNEKVFLEVKGGGTDAR